MKTHSFNKFARSAESLYLRKWIGGLQTGEEIFAGPTMSDKGLVPKVCILLWHFNN